MIAAFAASSTTQRASGSSQPPATSEASAGVRKTMSVGRVEKGQSERTAGRGLADGRVRPPILVTPPSPSASTLARRSARASAPLSTNRANRAPRDSASNSERPGAGEEVDDAPALDAPRIAMREDVEVRLANCSDVDGRA